MRAERGMLLLVGCNHRSAPLDLRERLAFQVSDTPRLLTRAVKDLPVAEAMLLSTCNRVELLVRGDGDSDGLAETSLAFLARESAVALEALRAGSYQLTEREAVHHLFCVATGLDSMVLGEPQILGQVKQAYRIAREAGTTGSVLERLLQSCLATAKRVRNETGISRQAVSVAFAAVSLARQIFGALGERTALVLGTGKMGELVARHLAAHEVGRLLFAGRTYSRVVATAERYGGSALVWDSALETLGEADIVVSCTGAAAAILDRRRVQSVLRARHGRPLLLIDIAVPRDIDPEVNSLDDVYLYDIDGLQAVIDANLDRRRRAAVVAQREIAVEVDQFMRWRRALEATPTIVALHERVNAMGQSELERYRAQLVGLTVEQRRTVEALVRGVIGKVLHRPVVHLRNAVEQGRGEAYLTSFRQIFGLDERPGEERETPPEERPSDAPKRSGPQRLLRGGKED